MFDEEPDGDPHGECAAEIKRLNERLADALFVLGMVDKNNRIDAGEKGKAWSGRFVIEEVRRVVALHHRSEDGAH